MSTSPSTSLPAMSLVAALAAAFAGALAWAGIAYVTELEIGYAAWGIGLLVGFVMVRFGGRGAPVGVLAAALTLASIFGGKLIAQELFLEQAIDELMEPATLRPAYDEHLVDADGWSELSDSSDDDEVREYMVAHAFTEAEDAADVHAPELADFRAYAVPMLERTIAQRPTMEQWGRLCTDQAWTSMAEVSRAGAVIDELGPIDLIFAALAVMTAFRLLTRAPQEPTRTASVTPTAPPATADQQHRRAA